MTPRHLDVPLIIMPRPHIGALSDDARLTSVCLSDVFLTSVCVCRKTTVIYSLGHWLCAPFLQCLGQLSLLPPWNDK